MESDNTGVLSDVNEEGDEDLFVKFDYITIVDRSYRRTIRVILGARAVISGMTINEHLEVQLTYYDNGYYIGEVSNGMPNGSRNLHLDFRVNGPAMSL
jgi:hypothetical protein